ncbi:restriction endonuclease subunit S [Pseudarthrobacter sp. MDT3-26]|nr:restriction endonuclease subunit S [Pseudarthrobacter sp. MDT3-26]
MAYFDDSVPFDNMRINSGMLILRTDESLLDSRYLYHFLRSNSFATQIESLTSGSAQPQLPVRDLGNALIPIPSMQEQRAIGEVLGAIDGKIAANTKLAAAADALVTTYFHQAVHGVAFSDHTFDDIAAISGGGTPSTKVLDYWDGVIPWATPTDITPLQGPYLESTNRTISQAGLSACASPLYPAGSILMTSRATIGAFALAQTPMAVNQGFIVVQPTDPTLNFWVFHEMRSRVDEFISLANGATFLELSRGNFKKFKVRLADPGAMEEFGRQAENLHAVARNALLENAKLAATRDVLLPQLMSGKIRVKDAEKVLETAVV